MCVSRSTFRIFSGAEDARVDTYGGFCLWPPRPSIFSRTEWITNISGVKKTLFHVDIALMVFLHIVFQWRSKRKHN